MIQSLDFSRGQPKLSSQIQLRRSHEKRRKHSLDDHKKAEKFANKINETDREWDEDCWRFDRYIYGSVAFQKNEAHANYMMMDEEEKAFHYG